LERSLAPQEKKKETQPHKNQTLNAKVLLAEDNHVNQMVASKMLKKWGCKVDVVANGLEALDAASRIHYDIVLMDCQMPEMDGYTATEQLHQIIWGYLKKQETLLDLVH